MRCLAIVDRRHAFMAQSGAERNNNPTAHFGGRILTLPPKGGRIRARLCATHQPQHVEMRCDVRRIRAVQSCEASAADLRHCRAPGALSGCAPSESFGGLESGIFEFAKRTPNRWKKGPIRAAPPGRSSRPSVAQDVAIIAARIFDQIFLVVIFRRIKRRAGNDLRNHG